MLETRFSLAGFSPSGSAGSPTGRNDGASIDAPAFRPGGIRRRPRLSAAAAEHDAPCSCPPRRPCCRPCCRRCQDRKENAARTAEHGRRPPRWAGREAAERRESDLLGRPCFLGSSSSGLHGFVFATVTDRLWRNHPDPNKDASQRSALRDQPAQHKHTTHTQTRNTQSHTTAHPVSR